MQNWVKIIYNTKMSVRNSAVEETHNFKSFVERYKKWKIHEVLMREEDCLNNLISGILLLLLKREKVKDTRGQSDEHQHVSSLNTHGWHCYSTSTASHVKTLTGEILYISKTLVFIRVFNVKVMTHC